MPSATSMDEEPQHFPRTPISQEALGPIANSGPSGQYVRDLNVLHQVRWDPVATMMDRPRAVMLPHLRHHHVERRFLHARHRGAQQKFAIAAFREPRIEIADLGENRTMAEARRQKWYVVAHVLEREPGHVPADHTSHRHFTMARSGAEDSRSPGPDPHVGPCGGVDDQSREGATAKAIVAVQ